MRIRKKEPSVGIIGKIVNSFTNSKNDTYSADYLNTALNKKAKLVSKTVTGLSLGAGSNCILNLPENSIWIEPLVDCWGNTTAGGTLVPIDGGAVYVVNNDKPVSELAYLGIWVTCNNKGAVTISDYRHNGLTITGFRIWYLVVE